MRQPAWMDGLHSVWSFLRPHDSVVLPPRITLKHAVTRLLAGGWLFLAVSAAYATAPVGATPGELEVTTRGSASYTIPIVIAPGTRGIQPKLTLTYDSQAGNGFIGHGWSLGGLSVIHRCGATILLDGFKGGVKYDANDKFCLDGERLVNVGGTEYRTRHETWQRIFASDTSSNPASFTVWAKDGYILEYGVTEDSRIQAQGGANVRVWALNRMTDRLGNYYTIQYQEDNANGDYRPDRIDYTGNTAQGLVPYNSAVFQYEARTDTPPRYEAGSVIKAMQRLTHVLSYTGTTLVRDYRLTYDNNGAVGRSRLTSVQECGTDGVCLPATQFGWQSGAVGFAATPNQFYWSTSKSDPIGFADINGDGKLDFYGWGSDGNTHVRFWGENGFGQETTLAWSTNKTADGPIGFADINGDGRADFWGWLANGNIRVRMSNGNGTFGVYTDTYWSTAKTDSPIGFADINGDGRADFWGWSNDGNVYVRISNGDGTFSASVSTFYGTDRAYGVTISFADVDGDGKADLIGERNGTVSNRIVVRLSNGDGSFGTEVATEVAAGAIYCDVSNSNCHPRFGDINGDDNADFFGIPLYWNGNYIGDSGAVSKGNGSFEGALFTGMSEVSLDGIADVNGDGNDDYYYWDSALSSIKVRLLDGGNAFPTILSVPITTSLSNNPGFADINGDGLADLYDWNSDGNIRVFPDNSGFFSSAGIPDLVASITNGLGEQQQLAYKPLTDGSVHVPALAQNYPYRAVQDATYVVSAVSKSDGLGGVVTTNYRYAGALRHVTANERLGFGWIQRVEPDGSWVNDFYNQDIYRFGTLLESATYVPGSNGGVMVKHVTNNWQTGTSAYERIMIRLFDTTEETYELNGSLTTQTKTSTVYDGYGYPTSTVVTRLDGRKKTTANTYFHDEAYWTLGLKTSEQVTAEAPGFTPETRTTEYQYYPGNGLLALETTEPTDSAYTLGKSYGYDVFGNLIRTTISGPNIDTRETTHTYNSTGRFITRTTNDLGHYEDKRYDPRNGQLVKHTGPNKLVTIWIYDGFGRKLNELRPDNTGTTYSYNGCDETCPALAVTMTGTAASGVGASWVYRDILGREVRKQTQGFGGAWVYQDTQYDNLGRVAKVTLPYFSGETPLYTVNEYDALQRVFRVTAPGNRVTATAYNGLSATVTNPLNQDTITVKDSEGHVTKTVDAAAGQTLSGYDGFGNLAQITDPAGNVTTMRYDRLGRRIEMNDPDRGHWTYAYNVLGELVGQTDAKNQTMTMAYDTLGRMVSRSTPEGAGTWSYDTAAYGIGKLASVGNSSATETTIYDSLGRLNSVTTSISGVTYTTTRTYDTYSRLLTLTYPVTGFTLYHVYDSYGYLTEVRKDTATGLRYWKADIFDARGHLSQETLGNGLTTQRAYDPATGGLLTIQTGAGASSASVQNQSYTYDALDNLTARAWWDGAATRSESFGYNANRLVTVTGPVNSTYSYSPDGNLLFKSGVGFFNYPTNGVRPHAASSVFNGATLSLSYDGNGNLTKGNGRTVAYNSFNKPTTMKTGATTTSYVYDANFNRLTKWAFGASNTNTVYIGKHYESFVSGGATTQKHYIYAGNNLVGVYSTFSNNTSNIRYFHTDRLGSVDTITNGTGGMVQRLSYDAWGKRRNIDGTDASSIAAVNPHGYTAQEHDDEVGFVNMQAREYDPTLARFLQPDPKGTKGDPHPYAYANNNPLKYIDPTGTSSYDPWGTSGGFSFSYGSSLSGFTRMQETWAWMDNTTTMLLNDRNRSLSGATSYFNDDWNLFNSSSSLGYAGGGGLLLTTFNTNWNTGGYSYTNIFNTPGAGINTGTPDFSGYSRNNIPTQPSSSSTYLDYMGKTVGGAGVAAGATEVKYFNNTSWLANTGERYSTAFHGNQYVGGYNEARAMSDTARNLGAGTFYAGSVISGYQLYDAYKNNDSFGVTKSGLDLSVGAAAWRIGGITGFGLGAAYYIGDMLLHSEDAY